MIKKALAQDKGDGYFRTKIRSRKRKRAALAQKGTYQGGARVQEPRKKRDTRHTPKTSNDFGTSNMATTPI